MTGKRVITEDMELKIEDWRERGRSVNWISKRLGVSMGAINYFCTKNAIDSPNSYLHKTPPGPVEYERKGRLVRKFTGKEDLTIASMRIDGARIVDIARALGRNRNSVGQRLLTLARKEERES